MHPLNRFPKILFFFAFFLLCALHLPHLATASPDNSRSIKVKLKTSSGKEESVSLYKGSYALLIGVSKYNAGWPMLEAIPSEIDQVDALLQSRGFEVTKIIDPDAAQLESGFEDFINDHGLEKDNRLLFFFSGHGFTRKDGKKGYLVPTDAPDPNKDLTGFLQKALGMNQVLSWARDIEAKHALFLFDSCFSGTIFKQKSRPVPPRHITRLTIEPVRQFITAGSAGEEVPANSTFTPAFIDALRYGLADLNKDGYVSATELGLYLQAEVPQHADQNPQFGKIKDYELSRGDFIFMTDATIEYDDISSNNQTPKTKTPYSSVAKLGILKIISDPPGAATYINNRFQGTTPVTLSDVAPGAHELRVDKSGYHTETKRIQVSSGKHLTVEFPLIELITGGTLTIVTSPVGTTIKIGDFNGYYSPGMRLPSGHYNLEISKYGYIPENIQVQLGENEDLHLNVTLKQQAAVVTPDNQEIEQKPIVAKPTIISPTHNKIVHAKLPGVPQDIVDYIDKLRSPNSKTKRRAAKTIYKRRVRHPALMEVIESELLEGYKLNIRDRHHMDAMAWLCNILGSTKQSRYKSTLQKVANSNTNEKLKKYALKNMRHLR